MVEPVIRVTIIMGVIVLVYLMFRVKEYGR